MCYIVLSNPVFFYLLTASDANDNNRLVIDWLQQNLPLVASVHEAMS